MTAGEPLLVSRRREHAEWSSALLARVERPPVSFVLPLVVTGSLTLVFFAAIAYTVLAGIGTWGNDVPVVWAFGITNFVFWIGIGHAGTFLSAFLLLLEQKWRTSLNRIAEAMTLFAVVNAGLFPLLHMGRPWFFYWLLPYPSTTGLWPQFRSALPWDVVAIGTYFVVSLLFFWLGLVPDLAAIRDRDSGRWRRWICGVLALGWSGSIRQWGRWRVAYGLLAGVATPLVLSVHSIVSMDFAIAFAPGWHQTHLPAYFVVGAVYSGLAMVVLVLVPLRRIYRLHDVVTARHLDALGKMLVAMGWMLLYFYAVELVAAWSSREPAERYVVLHSRPFGPRALAFWIMLACNGLVVQAAWMRRVRTNAVALWLVCFFNEIGMWLERFVVIVDSQARDFLPSSWGSFRPSAVDVLLLVGSFGFFGFLFLLFVRFVPFLPISELHALHEERAHGSRELR
jgi:Ni/Fe-hydrogenase subunit HybB-like protein